MLRVMERIIALNSDITIDDFRNLTIVVQNDLDGNEERIVRWNHTATQPTVAELEAVTLEE